MTEQHRAPMVLGDVLNYQDFRSAAHDLLVERGKLVDELEALADQAARSESTYQEAKAVGIVRLKAEQGVSGTEAVARIKGDELVAAALIDRDRDRQLLAAKRARIAGVDEASAHLRKLAEWSTRYDASYPERGK